MALDNDIDASARDPTFAERAAFRTLATPSEGLVTETWLAQRQIEQRVFLTRTVASHADEPQTHSGPSSLFQPVHSPHAILRDAHLRYLNAGLARVPPSNAGLHTSQPWLLYWMLHSHDLLNTRPTPPVAAAAVQHLRNCRHPSGGFGGGPGQEPHLACTYAAIAALVVIGTPESYDAIDPSAVRRFVRRLARPDGAFRISPGAGETDARSLYSAVAAASLAGVLDEDIAQQVGRYASTLVAFDNGLGGEPRTEAHGGNTYCGVAASAIAGRLHDLDVEAIIDWAALKQCRVEGGFCGRTNKLVDSCYSFWVGSLFAILDASEAMNADALQEYILAACQDARGGLKDKPGVQRDYHHTCYALSGLSVAQHYGKAHVLEGSGVRKVNVLYNVCEGRAEAALQYLKAKQYSKAGESS